jgi:hypothetical protein
MISIGEYKLRKYLFNARFNDKELLKQKETHKQKHITADKNSNRIFLNS